MNPFLNNQEASVQRLVSHPITFLVLSLVFMSVAAFLGAKLRRARPLVDDMRDDFGVVQSAALTLLALVIGFSLSMAVGRYDQRKNLEEEEANAIGTELLRAQMLPPAQASTIRMLLAEYTTQRIKFYEVRDGEELQQVSNRTAQLQDRLWSEARAGASAQPSPLTALAITGMNDVINTQGYTQAAWWNHIPASSWALMAIIGFLCNVLIGYGTKSKAPAQKFLLIMPFIVSISFTLIADIDSPRNGLIKVKPQNLLATASAMPRQPVNVRN
ncbi:bestrophin-like domain [Paraburkholderia caledonica]|uniref:bestrophin-like domain n=1 Tax=Paraburkholderia caledonica TaxID=134536 RepID=UPI0038BB9B7A